MQKYLKPLTRTTLCISLLFTSYNLHASFLPWHKNRALRTPNSTYAVWLQPYYNYSKQKSTGDTIGYRANTGGFTIGADKQLNDKVELGIAVGLAHTLQKSVLTSETYTYINNYLIVLYGAKKYEEQLKFDWSLAGGKNYYKGTRLVQSTPTYIKASSNYVGKQYAALGIISKRYNKEGYDLIPQFNANLMYAAMPEYTETGIGFESNTISQSTSALLMIGTGIQVEWPQSNRRLTMTPEIHALAFYDLNMGFFNSVAGFISGAPALSTSQNSRGTLQFGAGYDFQVAEQLSIKAEYDIQLKKYYYNNILFLKFKYTF